ncbi:ABC transporter substrate-binding protein [Salinispira pacifica]|uniref:sn-glycerol-3-phosphate-binding periplasmic protein UgpB n=1 Tax=Salinispira pacifica TaxID=1307761 RepID=V5WKS9_9SPIO|nr:extracellular solute-binding protein [Salinispira pacifica]AHC16432.1 extracellular solute-binding protein, family 1 [Salinispira pacifica]
MKKALVLFVVLALLGGMVFAEGQGEASSEKVVLNVMGYGDNSNAEGIAWNRLVTTFMEENPDIEIVSELLYDEAYHQKVTARLAAGDVPHVAYMGADARWGAPWQEAGQQIDHRPFLDTDMYDMSLIPEMGPNGEVYYVPLGTSNITTVLFANEPLINELGFELPETYEDMVAMVSAADEAGLEVVSIDGADGWAWGSCVLSAFIGRASGDTNWVSKAVAGENNFDDPAMVQALGWIEQMVEDGVIAESSVLVDYGTNISNFSNEQALFMVQGQWAAGSVENTEVRENMKLMAWPELPGQDPATAGSVAAAWQVGYGLTKAATEDPALQAAAVRFLDYVNREEEATQRLRDGAIVAPILKGYEAPDDLPNELVQKVELAQTALNTEVIDAHLSGAPNDTLNAGMQEIVNGTKSPAEVASEVEELARN